MTLPRDFLIERYFAEHEFTGVGLLCCSDCETMSIGDLLALEPGAAERHARLGLGYTESPGDPELRALIADFCGTIAARHVIVHASGVEPIHNLFRARLAPGDQVVIQTPAYGAAPGGAAWIGCRVREWPLREEPIWHADLDELAGLLEGGAKLVYITTPHNPTGWHATPEELADIGALCARYGAVLLVDEAYRGSEHEPAALGPGGCALGPHAVSLGVLSKAFGLAGLRLGWLATTDETLLRELTVIKDYTSICTAAPSEHLAAVALRHRDTILERNRALILGNLELVRAFLNRHAELLAWSEPAAGPVGFVRLLDGSAVDFCARARSEADVLLLPSSTYDWGDRHFRLGFGRADCPEMLARLDAWLRRG